MKKFYDNVNSVNVYLNCSEVVVLKGPYEYFKKKSMFNVEEKYYYLTYTLKSGFSGTINSHFKGVIENYMQVISKEKNYE